MTLEALEAALETSWTRANLAVYSDHLQAIGDRRGDLIAIDLHVLSNGTSPEIEIRREELVRQCFMSSYPRSKLAYGFVSDLDLGSQMEPPPSRKLEVFLASRMGPYLRGLTLDGPNAWLKTSLVALARTRHRWLSRITLRCMDAHTQLASERTMARLVIATPRLETLELVGYTGRLVPQLLAGIEHPNARVVTDPVPAPSTWFMITIAGRVPATIELGRFARLHAGIVATLSDPARNAWAELRFAVEHLPSHGAQMFPAGLLDAALDELDPALYYASDWSLLRDGRNAGAVALERV